LRNLLRIAAAQVFKARRRLDHLKAARFTKERTPELLVAYEKFRAASQSGNVRQPFKGWDLWRILDHYRPRFIAEMGSGTTSAVFALWARRNGARYIAYEHHAGWAKVSEDCLRQARLIDGPSPVRVVASRPATDRPATGFTEPIPTDADFIYVDGPPCNLENGRKVPNDDVVRLFEQGGKPRVIVVDGRLETVDLIRQHPEGRHYHCGLNYSYSYAHGLWRDLLQGREHTVFVRAGA
jgi:hypothetical protein